MVASTSVPDSILSKNDLSILYHYIRESVMARFIWITHIEVKLNPADVFTKLLASGIKKPHIKITIY